MTADVITIDTMRRVDVDDALLTGLPSLVDGVEVRFPPAMPEHVQRLLGTLGARVIFDPTVPIPWQWHAE